MFLSALGWSLMIFREINFWWFSHFLVCITGRRVLRTPLTLPEGVPQVLRAMWSCNIARQRGPLGPETSTGPCLTASYHEIYHFYHHARHLGPPNLSHMDFLDVPAAIHGSKLMNSRTTQDASPNEHIYLEILMKNHRIFTYSVLGSGPAVFLTE